MDGSSAGRQNTGKKTEQYLQLLFFNKDLGQSVKVYTKENNSCQRNW